MGWLSWFGWVYPYHSRGADILEERPQRLAVLSRWLAFGVSARPDRRVVPLKPRRRVAVLDWGPAVGFGGEVQRDGAVHRLEAAALLQRTWRSPCS